MNNPNEIKKIAEVDEASMLIEADERDDFIGIVLQTAALPHVFPFGKKHTLVHTCIRCNQEVYADYTYPSKHILAGGTLSRQDFRENRILLDSVGHLFNQYLYHNIDGNGFESYLYLNYPDNSRGALLQVDYYRCPHCEAQYLVLYQNWLKEGERPPFEPDEVSVKKIYLVELNHNNFLKSFEQPIIKKLLDF